jgi:hypothetical protein
MATGHSLFLNLGLLYQMSALDRLKKAVSMQPQRKAVDLPDGSEFDFWMSPLTLAERARAQKLSKADDNTDLALQLLVSKAKDKNGVPMFTQGDLAELRNSLPASLVESLMLLLLDSQESDGDEALDMKSDQETPKGGQSTDGGTRRSRKTA